MRKRIVILVLSGVIVGAGIYFLGRSPSAPQSSTPTIPKGPPPALAPGFPPAFPGATFQGIRTQAIEGGWTRMFDYTVQAKADEIIAFYRKELMQANLQVMAEGGGTYGGMLRAQAKNKKRAVYVDVDAPEEKPKEIPKIVVTVIDSQ